MRGVVVQTTFKGSGVERYVYAPIEDDNAQASPPAAHAMQSAVTQAGPGIHPSAATATAPPAIDPLTGLPAHTPTVDPAAAYPQDLASALEPEEPRRPVGFGADGDPDADDTDTDEDAEDENLTPVARAVRDVIRQCGRTPERIVAHLAGEHVSLRRFTLPAGAAKMIAEVLPHQIDDLIPFPVDESVLDYQIIEQTETELHLLVAAVRREHVAQRLQMLKDAGIDARELMVGAAALDGLAGLGLPALRRPERTLPPALTHGDPSAPGGISPGFIPDVPDADMPASDTAAKGDESESAPPVLVVDLGETTTEVAVLQNETCRHARTITGGMNEVLERRKSGLENSLRRTLAQYRMTGDPPPVRVILGGAGALHPRAAGWLERTLEIPVEVVSLPDAEGAPFETLPVYMRAAALAGRSVLRGRRMDLRKGEFASTHAMGEVRKYVRLFAACAAALLFSFSLSLYARYTVASAERDELQAQLGTMTEEIFGRSERTSSPTRARELLSGEGAQRNPLPRLDAYRAMGAIAAVMPEEITHTTKRLTIEYDDEARDGHIEIQGTVASAAQRDTLAAAIEGHECFDDIRPGATSLRNGVLTYRLEAQIRCPGEQPAEDEEDGGRGGRGGRRGR